MSTRAVFSFKDQDGKFHVYKHHDGYPSGAVEAIGSALKNAWPLPRFEADEFAAAFVAANKTSPGGVRLTGGPAKHGDLEYYYMVTFDAKTAQLMVAAYNVTSVYGEDGQERERFFNGTFKEFSERFGESKAA